MHFSHPLEKFTYTEERQLNLSCESIQHLKLRRERKKENKKKFLIFQTRDFFYRHI